MSYADERHYAAHRNAGYNELKAALAHADNDERHRHLAAYEQITRTELARMKEEREADRADRARARAHEHRLAKYGLTQSDYDALERAQNGRCAICKRPPARHILAIDHDHRTDAVRGLLCTGCNTLLGLANDDPAFLRACADYLDGQR